MRSGNLVSGPGFAFIINGGHSLIGGGDYQTYLAGCPWKPKEGFLFWMALPCLGGPKHVGFRFEVSH